jgi:glyoxylase-like metal-dependent hydrolase (beta-lactamase superfamily II)
MAHTEISTHSTVPVASIADGVSGLRIAFVNVFAVLAGERSWTLIDAGLPYSASHIRSWAESNFAFPPAAILLTHGHFDHVSAAAELADHWNIPIYAHELEAPYLTGEKEYPKPDTRASGGLMTLLSPIYPRGPVNLSARLRLLSSSDREIDPLPGWEVLHTPGHTPRAYLSLAPR